MICIFLPLLALPYFFSHTYSNHPTFDDHCQLMYAKHFVVFFCWSWITHRHPSFVQCPPPQPPPPPTPFPSLFSATQSDPPLAQARPITEYPNQGAGWRRSRASEEPPMRYRFERQTFLHHTRKDTTSDGWPTSTSFNRLSVCPVWQGPTRLVLCFLNL